VRSYNGRGKALDRNCQKHKGLNPNRSAERLPVLLVNEMVVKRKQHKGLLNALKLSMTQHLLDSSTVSRTMRIGGCGTTDSVASRVIEACCGSEACENAPYLWNPLLRRTNQFR